MATNGICTVSMRITTVCSFITLVNICRINSEQWILLSIRFAIVLVMYLYSLLRHPCIQVHNCMYMIRQCCYKVHFLYGNHQYLADTHQHLKYWSGQAYICSPVIAFFLPLQVMPSPVYPCRQVHKKLPNVFVQLASEWHGNAVVLKHSSKSV